MTFPGEADILERRLAQLHRLPWPLPAAVVMEMTSVDFDALDMAPTRDEWWGVLRAIVERITDELDMEVA